MSESLTKQLDKLLRPVLTAMGYDLWGFELHQAGRHTLLRIYIDVLNLAPEATVASATSIAADKTKKNVSLDDCVKVSQQISALLDVEDPIKGQYTLEVSSPGLNRQLFTIDQYQKFIGSQVDVTLFKAESGRKKFVGFLRSAQEDKISLEVEGTIFVLARENVRKTNVLDYKER